MSRHTLLIKKIRQTLDYADKKLPKEVAVILISSRQSRLLNLLYRRKNFPTNVLSFCYSKDYGEILVCPEVVRKEAKAQGNSYRYQMTWMVLHGMLHLAGIHHERSKPAADRVEKLEEKILSKIFK